LSGSRARFPKAAANRLPPEIGRLVGSLWAGCDLVEGDVGDRARVPIVTFTVLPNLRHPRLLVPTKTVRAARTALRQYNDGMSQLARIRKAAIGNALGVGLGRLVGSRLHVIPGIDPTTDPLLADELEDLFGERRLEIAVFFGEQLRPNRKPVLQVMTERGDVLGYAKVGWNPLTKRLVANEADALRSMMASPPTTFRVPRLLGETQVGDLRITVVSPFPHSLLRRGALGATAPYAATREVASRGGIEPGTLVGSDYERELRRRIESVPDVGRRERLARLFDLVRSEDADAVLTFGSWHGDWTPWNMSRTRTGLVVWDWERSGRPVPVGLDVVHHRFQFRWRGGRESVVEAGAAARTESSETLVRLGVSEPNHELLLRLYLLELMVRFEEGRETGQAVSPTSMEIERTIHSWVASR
jgi:hypothetical protein